MLTDWSIPKLSPIERLLLHKCYVWLEFTLACVRMWALSKWTLPRMYMWEKGTKEEKTIFIVNINLAIDQWYDQNLPVFYFGPNDVLSRCAHHVVSSFSTFLLLLPLSFACSGTKCEVIKAFNQIKIHLDHFAVSSPSHFSLISFHWAQNSSCVLLVILNICTLSLFHSINNCFVWCIHLLIWFCSSYFCIWCSHQYSLRSSVHDCITNCVLHTVSCRIQYRDMK